MIIYTLNYDTTAGLIVSERYYTGMIKKMEKTKKIKKTRGWNKKYSIVEKTLELIEKEKNLARELA